MITFASFFSVAMTCEEFFSNFPHCGFLFIWNEKKSQTNHGLYVLLGFVHERIDEEKHFYNDKRITQVKFKYNSDNSNRI